MTALRGADALERAFSVVTQPRVVCIKFRPRSTSLTGVVSPPPSLPSSPVSEEPRVNVQVSPGLDSVFDVKQTGELDGPGEWPHDVYKGEGEWIVLDMLDDHGESCHSLQHQHAIKHFQHSQAFSASFTAKLRTQYPRPLSLLHPSSPSLTTLFRHLSPHRSLRTTQFLIPNGASILSKMHVKLAWGTLAKPWHGCSGPKRSLGKPCWATFATIAKLFHKKCSTRLHSHQTFTAGLMMKVTRRARWSGKDG